MPKIYTLVCLTTLQIYTNPLKQIKFKSGQQTIQLCSQDLTVIVLIQKSSPSMRSSEQYISPQFHLASSSSKMIFSSSTILFFLYLHNFRSLPPPPPPLPPHFISFLLHLIHNFIYFLSSTIIFSQPPRPQFYRFYSHRHYHQNSIVFTTVSPTIGLFSPQPPPSQFYCYHNRHYHHHHHHHHQF